MKLVDKIKNMFTEEVEEEIPTIKKEVMHVEINTPKVEQENKIIHEEAKITEEPKTQEKTVPIFFDDKDFDVLEKPKPKPEKIVEKEPEEEKQPSFKDKYKGTPVVEVRQKIFKPSPIISPVYGILDKNYKKEDIDRKPTNSVTYVNSKEVTIDSVREKAYGTLEDDIETTLFGKQDEYKHESKDGLLDDLLLDDDKINEKLEDEFNNYEDFKHSRMYKNYDEKSSFKSKNFNDEVENEIKSEKFLNENNEMSNNGEDDFELSDDIMNNYKNDVHDNDEDISDSDLFDLIDSMYEKSDSDE